MELRRPILAFTTTLLLVGGGALTACGDPVNGNTGTPRDTASNTSQHGQTQDTLGPQPSSGASRAGQPAN
jgi:hypothetical protein